MPGTGCDFSVICCSDCDASARLARKNSGQDGPLFPRPQRKKSTRFRKSCGARFCSAAKSWTIKAAAQRIQTAETIELVPQILRPKRILVPTDFSETSKKAVQYALRFAEQFGCEIVLLYVVEPATPMIGAPLAVEPFTDKDEFSMAEKDLAVLAAESHTNGAHSVSSFVRVGHAPMRSGIRVAVAAEHFLAFALQKLLTHEAAMFPVIARTGEKLATEEQRECSATVRR